MRLFKRQAHIETIKPRTQADIERDIFELTRAYEERRFRMLSDMERDKMDFELDKLRLMQEVPTPLKDN